VIYQPRPRRPRRTLRAAAALALTGLLAACGGAPPGGGAAGGGGGRIVVYGGTGAIEEIMRNTIIPRFQESSGITVTYQGVTSAEALSKVLGQRGRPEASLVIANDRDITRGFEENLWTRLDTGRVPTLSQLDASNIRDDGHSVSLGIGAVGIAYNAKILAEQGIAPPSSWLDLFDSRFAHRVVMYDYAIGTTPPAIYMINQALGGRPDDFTPALERIRQHRQDVLAFPVQTAEWDQLFAQGTGWVGYTFSTRVGIAKKNGLPLEFAYPSEGAPAFSIQGVIPQGAPSTADAERFLDFLLQPEQQQMQAQTQFYAPVNPAAKLDAETAALVPDVTKLVRPDIAQLNRINKQVLDQWQRIVGG
jgi:putative spermidine/putrescine transport system substrate-binding protein